MSIKLDIKLEPIEFSEISAPKFFLSNVNSFAIVEVWFFVKLRNYGASGALLHWFGQLTQAAIRLFQ